MSNRTLDVDRIEGDQAVLIAGDVELVLPRAWLPDGVREGSVVRINFQLAEDDEIRLRREVEATLNRLDCGTDPSETTEIDL